MRGGRCSGIIVYPGFICGSVCFFELVENMEGDLLLIFLVLIVYGSFSAIFMHVLENIFNN